MWHYPGMKTTRRTSKPVSKANARFAIERAASVEMGKLWSRLGMGKDATGYIRTEIHGKLQADVLMSFPAVSERVYIAFWEQMNDALAA